MKYKQFFVLLLCCIANINLTTANINKISSHANPPTTVTVYFNANGGNSANMPTSVSIEYGFMYGDVTGTWNWIASKSGFNFIGWNTAADGSGYFVGPVSHCAETTTHTLYAIFEEASSQDVSLCPDGSAVISASSGARQYEWLTTAGLDDASSQKPTLSASALTPGNTYDYVCKLEAPNCIYNYDFNLGNVGFYSDYQWSDTAIVEQDNLYKQRTYGYISDAHNAHPAWFNIRSHNNDGGKFMICNGGAFPDDIVWEEAVKVEPNTNYVFSAWAANVFIEEDTVAAELQLYVNGTAIGGITKVIYHDWIKIEAYWNSGSNQYAALQIKNHATRDTGNDFGLDDIEFYPADGSYDTITVTVNPTFTPGAISSTGQTIHQGGAAATIGNVTSAAGGDGNISYQWFEGSNAIEGATSASYKPGSAYTETMGVYTFTRKAKDATCATTFTTSEGSYVLTTIEPVHTVLGLTRTGKEVDCSTMDPEEDKTITEHGKIVTSPRVTRNGKIITEECSGCGTDLSITDTVDCTSITLKATITDGDPTSAILKVYSDAAHTSQLGSDINATISGDEISAVASGLNCHTRYHFMLETTDASGTCTFDWTDSTRDMTMEKVTTCTVASVSLFEHGYEGSTTEIDSVYDHQGNAYAVVQIGNQCWLKENMRATTTPDEHLYFVNPKHLTGINYTQSVVSRVAHWYKNDSTTYAKYGLLYNWCAAMNISKSSSPKVATGNDIDNIWSFSGSTNHRGICPQGWHVPTDAECITMTNNVVTQYQSGSTPNPAWNQTDVFTGANTKIASMIAGGCEWKTSGSATRGPAKYKDSLRNITALSLMPGGYANPEMGGYTEAATFWTATQKGSSGDNRGRAWSRYIDYGEAGMLRDANFKYYGRSVRCLRDHETSISVVVDSVTCTSMMVSAEVSGLDAITGKTVCAYKNADFTGTSVCAAAADMRVSNDSIYATIKNLDCDTRYYVKITATDGANNAEITISDSTRDMSFENLTTCTVGSVRALGIGTDLSHEHGYNGSTTEIDSVYDHQGNAYAVVQIGEQCWLKENMRATTRPSGTNILQVPFSDKSLSSPRAYYYENDINNYYKYGCLYNFPAAMDIDDLSKSFPYPHRGICPEGWHVPSDADWTTLATNAGVGVTTGTGAGKLAGGCAWRESPNATAPGNYSYSDRNATSFYALPAAGCRDGVFNSLTAYANFWSTLPEINNQAYYRDLSYEHQYMGRVVNPRSFAYSVRCLRDPIITDTITFDANNGNGVMPQQIVERGIKVTLDSNEFTHTGTYAFIGWNTQRNGYGTAYADADSIVTNGNVTLYAQWHTYCSGNIRSNEAGTTRIDSVRDVDNNWYKVIEIGTQCWLAENMRVTHGKNSGEIPQATVDVESATQPYYYDYASSDLTLRERGLLYNWSAAVDSTFDALSSESYTNRQGICPDGWHLPSDQEWFIMEKNTLIHDGIWDTVTLAENSGILEERDAHITGAGRWVTGDEDAWESDTHPTSPGNFWYSERNMIGLNVIPTGDYKPALHPQHGLTDDGIGANFWTSTTSTQGPGYAVGRDVDNSREAVLRHYYEKEFGRSVRCIRDLPLIPEFSLCEDTTFGTVTLKEIKNAEKIEFIQNGSVVKTILNPDSAVFVNDLAQGNYKIKATSSTEDTVVDNAYVKHTYTHCTGIAHAGTNLGGGKWANKEWSSVTNQIDSVSDHEGNVYEVVQIGNQCWLKENMRCTTSVDGTPILKTTLDGMSETEQRAYYYNDDPVKAAEYGVLYNWLAAMNGASLEGARGICPQGWHLPSDTEWTALEKIYLTDGTNPISDISLNAIGFRGKGAGKFASSCKWNDSDNTTSPCSFSYAERNVSGFSAIPAGNYNGAFYAINDDTYFYSSTLDNEGHPYARYFNFLNEGINRTNNLKNIAYSIRCVRDIIDVSATSTHKTCNAISISAKINNVHPIVSKQVCAYKNSDFSDTPVCANSITTNIAGDSIFATIVGLDCNTRYHIKVTVSDAFNSAVATLSDSTQDLSLNPTTYCTVASAIAQDGSSDQSHEHLLEGSSDKIDLVFDHQGNDYKVVEINGMCVMRQNMRCNNGPSGANVYNIIENPASFDKSNSNPIIRYPKADFNYVEEFGFLYNYPAALDVSGAPTSFAENYRGICPKGWHLPTENEINTIISGITSDRLSTSCYWDYSGNANTPGNFNETDRNNTGFSMLPVGAWDDGGYKFGTCAFYWTLTQTTPVDANHARGHHFQYNGDGHWPCNSNRYDGYAVRCVRNLAGITLGAVTKTDYTRNSLSISAAYTATKTVTSATICAYTNEDCTESATPICATGSDVTIGESAITGTIEGLEPNTQYYVKVTATTEGGTASKAGGSFGTKTCIIPTLGLCETCNEGTITVKVSENVESIVWRNASNDSVSNSMTGLTQSATIPAGVYTATAKSSDGCTVTRTAVLGEYVAHPCTVTSLRAGTLLEGGKYANKEYGTGTQLDSVSDHEGNVYRVVQIGDQCWLAENMRATTSPSSHKRILMNMVSSYSSKSAGWYNNDSTTYSKYGVLYNWCAAVDTFLNDGQTSHPELANETGHSSTDWPVTMPAGPRRGICPEGWHVPTEAEWSTMPTAAGCTASYESGTGLGKLAGGCDWSSSSTATAPGDYSYTDRNSSGFSTLPAGLYNGSYSSFTTVDYNAGFWSSTPFLSSYAYHRTFGFNREYVYRYTGDRNAGFSVRCVRDN